MNFKGKLLVIPDKVDDEREAVARAWLSGGGDVSRLGRFWDPPAYESNTVRLYGNSTFCEVLAQKLSLQLLSPIDDLLMRIENKWLSREVKIVELDELSGKAFPLFVKSLVPKLFRSTIYSSLQDLSLECEGLAHSTLVLTSSLIELSAEARAFVLGGEVLTAAIYDGQGDLVEARSFIDDCLRDIDDLLPYTYVVDVGLLSCGKWVLLEANATWGAGLNGCCPNAVAQCLVHSTEVK